MAEYEAKTPYERHLIDQLAAANARAGANLLALDVAAQNAAREKARADAADGHSNELLRRAVNAERALAAARRECDALRATMQDGLNGAERILTTAWDGQGSPTDEAYPHAFGYLAEAVRAALAGGGDRG